MEERTFKSFSQEGGSFSNCKKIARCLFIYYRQDLTETQDSETEFWFNGDIVDLKSTDRVTAFSIIPRTIDKSFSQRDQIINLTFLLIRDVS